MTSLKTQISITAATLLFAGVSNAVVIPSLFNTGVDASGNVLSPGATDLHWDITQSPDTSYVAPLDPLVQTPHPVWTASDAAGSPGSAWVGFTDAGVDSIDAGDATIQTTFDLSPYLLNTVEISLTAIADNGVTSVLLNGSPISVTTGTYNVAIPAPTTISSGFVSGLNTLEMTWGNNQSGPSGIRVEISGTGDLAAVPEPSTLLVFGVAGCFALLRRRR